MTNPFRHSHGRQECYEDVRELLLNFRERLHKEGFIEGVRTVIDRFEGQSRMNARLESRGVARSLRRARSFR